MPKSKCLNKNPFTVVIKIGTSSIVHEVTHQPLLSTLSAIVETVIQLRNAGHKVVLVSSGAIGVGLKRMELQAKPKTLSGKQALAAIGQGRLIALWDNLFSQLGQPIAQVLLTRGDLSDRTRYLNAVNTLTELLMMGVVPIINENDTISVSEIRFGDNDTLSAIAASMIHADYLFLLTDVDSLYTSNPRKDPNARPIDVVPSVHEIRSQVSTATLGSKLGTGGMETKLIAAEIATGAGVATVITSSKNPENIFKIIEYIVGAQSLSYSPFSNTSPRQPSDVVNSGTSTPDSYSGAQTPGLTDPPNPNASLNVVQKLDNITRPPHTLFLPSALPLRDLKQWTSYTLNPSGSVIIDEGAHRHLSKREAGGRLLPVGVLDVEGVFASGQAVKVAVRQRKRNVLGERGDSKHSLKHAEVLKLRGPEDSTSGTNTPNSPPTQPSTPILFPQSLASSISSIDPLSRSSSLTWPIDYASVSSTTTQRYSHHFAAFDAPPAIPEAREELDISDTNRSTGNLTELLLVEKNNVEKEEWEDVEIGRGLANYNALEIQKVRGKKSSDVASLLGYADSEYVVEHITIRDAYKFRP